MTENQTIDVSRKPLMRNSIIAVALLALGVAFSLVLPRSSSAIGITNYVLLHTILETFTVVIGGLVFTTGWNGNQQERSRNTVVLACGFLGVSLLNFSHLLSFPGMPVYVTPNSLEKAINFWLAERTLAAAVLLAIVLPSWGPFVSNATRYVVLAGTLATIALVYWVFLFHPDALPRTFVPGRGLTSFKIGAEYTIMAMNLLAAFILWRRMYMLTPYNSHALFVAVCAMAFSELFFTLYTDETDTFNLLGHFYKVISYFYLYRGIFVDTVERPYRQLDAAMEQVRVSVKLFRATLNALPAKICVLDDTGKIVSVNRDWRDFAAGNGADPDKVSEGANYYEVCAAATGEECITANAIVDGIREVALGQKDRFDIEYPCHSPKELRWFIALVTRYQVNNVVRIVVAHFDITQRKNAEGEIRKLNENLEVLIAERTRDLEMANTRLKESEEAIRAVVDNMTDCVITIDSYGVVHSANPAVERVLGYSPGEIIGHNVSSIMPEPHRSGHDAYLERYARTGEAHVIGIGREVEGRHKNGHLIPLDLSISEYVVHAKPFFTGILRDRSVHKRLFAELTRAREKAEQANQAKSTFLATMSHEIRTPMNGVTGMLELLSLTPLDDSQRTTLKVVRESSKTLMRIIDDILDFSKIEAQKLSINPEATRIGNLLENVRNTYASNASSKGLLIYCRVDGKISPALMVDSVRLRQILNNFVSNAIKFTSSGQIDITADLIERSENEERVRFCVKDTGIGIAKEQQERLFQPFIQAEFNTTRRYGGTGLGLAISRRLVDLMGGSIDMVSEPGKGSTVVMELSLPISDLALLTESDALNNSQDLPLLSTDSIRPFPKVAQAEAEGTLVLLVDDHPINRMLLTRQLNLLGYAAQSAENGLQALQMWKTGRYRLVLTDCNMPEMDGYELARSIRKLEASMTAKRCPIIACTANVMGGEAAICLEAGMDDYIAKPANLKSLLSKLECWLPLPANPAPGLARYRADLVPATSPLDHAMLADITSGDASLENKLFIVFRRANDEDAQRLTQAVADRDSAQVKRLAHLIKGASAMVGATDLSSICERIELANQSGDWGTVLANLTKFQQEVVKLNHYFAELADRATVTQTAWTELNS